MAVLEHYDESTAEVDQHNRVIAAAARELIVGPDTATVMTYLPHIEDVAKWSDDPSDVDIMDGWAQIPPENRQQHEHDWHRLISVAATTVQDGAVVDLDAIDYQALAAAKTAAPFFFAFNRPYGPSGLHPGPVHGTIDLDLRLHPDPLEP